MAILVIVMVGKVTEWLPGISGLPLAKVAFLFVVAYTAREWHKLAPVRVRSLRVAKPALAFLVLSILSVFFSIYKSNTLSMIESSIIMLITFVMLVKITQTLRDVERMLLALIGSAVSLSAGVLFNYSGGQAHINDNFDPNDIAYALDSLLPIVLGFAVTHSRYRKWLAYGLALSMILAILLTGSRGGVIGLGVVLLALIAFPLKLSKSGELGGFAPGGMIVKLALLAMLGGVVWGNLPAFTKLRLATLEDLQHDYNADPHLNASRNVLWRRDIELSLKRPIGYGLGSAPAADGLAGGQFRTAHNSFVQAVLELGILGLVLFVSIYVLAWKELGKIVRRGRQRSVDPETARAALYARALRVGLAGNAVAGFFLSQAYSYCLFMIVAISAALVRIAPTGSVASDSPVRLSGPVRPRADA
jgi:O-antigen ligase